MYVVKGVWLEPEERKAIAAVIPFIGVIERDDDGHLPDDRPARRVLNGLALDTTPAFQERWYAALSILDDLYLTLEEQAQPGYWRGQFDAGGRLISEVMVPERERAMEIVTEARAIVLRAHGQASPVPRVAPDGSSVH